MQDEQSRKQDDELIARTQAGDAAAFDELIVKYSPRLYGLVYNMTSNHEDTNDLMQDIWAKAFRSINGFRGKSSFYTWIHSIGVNMTINFLKKRNRRYHLSLDDVDAGVQNDRFIELTAGNAGPRGEETKRLNEAMQASTIIAPWLPCSTFRCRTEIAKILGISEGTVRSLFYAPPLQNFTSS